MILHPPDQNDCCPLQQSSLPHSKDRSLVSDLRTSAISSRSLMTARVATATATTPRQRRRPHSTSSSRQASTISIAHESASMPSNSTGILLRSSIAPSIMPSTSEGHLHRHTRHTSARRLGHRGVQWNLRVQRMPPMTCRMLFVCITELLRWKLVGNSRPRNEQATIP